MTPNSASEEITTTGPSCRFPRTAARTISDKSANDQAARMARDVRDADTWAIDATPFAGTAAKAKGAFGSSKHWLRQSFMRKYCRAGSNV